MARITYGGVVTRIAGKVGGWVFQRIGTTDSLRVGGYNNRTSSPTSIESRNQFRKLANLWKTLTVAQRNTWTTYAPTWPIVDNWGYPMSLTGYKLFLHINRTVLCADIQPLSSLVQYVAPLGQRDGAGNFDLTNQSWVILFGAAAREYEYLMVYLSDLNSPSYSSNYPKYTYAFLLTIGAGGSVNAYSQAVAHWGRTPKVGDKFYYDSRVISSNNLNRGHWNYSGGGFMQAIT